MPDNFQREGFVGLPGGMNGAIPPAVLPDTQFSFGLNLSVRNGSIRTRPTFTEVLSLPDGRFQGAAAYRKNSVDRIVCCISGIVYTVNLDSLAITEIATFPTTDFDKAYFCQADQYMVVQNGILDPVENWPIILNGDSEVDVLAVTTVDPVSGNSMAVGSLADPEAHRTPIGSVMQYAHGRLFVVVSRLWVNGSWTTDLGSRFFVASNIIKPERASEVLVFTEEQYFSNSSAFSLPAEVGFINASGIFRNAATGSGYGSLIFFARDGVAAYAVSAGRAQWNDTDLGQMLFMNHGTVSPWGVAPVNDDLFFRAEDGIRSVRFTKSKEGSSSGSMSSSPLSNEIASVLDLDSHDALPYVSMTWITNRLLCTAVGAETTLEDDTTEPYFKALTVLDTLPVSSVTQDGSPVWAGIWTGPKFNAVLKARRNSFDLLFTVVRRDAGLRLWQLDETGVYDPDDTSPLCRLYTRAFTFGDAAKTKEFKYADLWISNAEGPVVMKVYWRPDGYALWNTCNTVSLDACVDEPGSLPQHRFRLRFTPGSDTYDPVTQRNTKMGAVMQFCIEWTGKLTLDKALFYVNAGAAEQSPNVKCGSETCTALVEGDGGEVLDDYAAYEV